MFGKRLPFFACPLKIDKPWSISSVSTSSTNSRSDVTWAVCISVFVMFHQKTSFVRCARWLRECAPGSPVAVGGRGSYRHRLRQDRGAEFLRQCLGRERIHRQAQQLHQLVPESADVEQRRIRRGVDREVEALSTRGRTMPLRFQRVTASLMPKPIRKIPASFSSKREMAGLARRRSARRWVSRTAIRP